MSTSHLTTHVLDTGSGKPAADVAVTLHRLDGGRWVQIAEGATDADFRFLWRQLERERKRRELKAAEAEGDFTQVVTLQREVAELSEAIATQR